MNLTDLARLTRRHLAEAGTGVYNDGDIDAQLVRSARDLAKQFRLFHRTAALAPDAQGYITLPADFLGLASIHDDNGEVSELTLPTRPTTYGHTGWTYDPADLDHQNRVQIHGLTRGVLSVRYYAAPPAPDSSTEAWAGRYSEYHDLIALHAAHQLSGGNGPSAARESVWLERLNQRLGELRASLTTERLTTRRGQMVTRTRFPSRRY